MAELSFGNKIAWFLYQKGMGVAKPEFLFMLKPGDAQWFQLSETLMKDNNLQGRSLVMDQLLRPTHFRNHPKRLQFLRMLAQFLSKGILDERRRAAKYIDDNPGLFDPADDVIMGPLFTAQRDSDTVTATTAESAMIKIKGEVKQTRKDFR